jgi:hypothetical protein
MADVRKVQTNAAMNYQFETYIGARYLTATSDPITFNNRLTAAASRPSRKPTASGGHPEG